MRNAVRACTYEATGRGRVLACASNEAGLPPRESNVWANVSKLTISLAKRFWTPDSRARRLLIGLAVYLACFAVFASVAGPARLSRHTDANHYALLADAWLHGRQDLAGGWPAYTHGNDFAQVDEPGGVKKTYISFPPFPAVLMIPFVKLAGSPEEFQDGQFIVWLAGLGPAFLFLALEKLRRTKRSPRSERTNAMLALLFAFGSVYFFTAVEGTVWFAAHVVGVALAALYLLFAFDAERPVAAGAMIACMWMTRPPMLLLAALFALEAVRVSCKGGLPSEGTFWARARETWTRVDKRALLERYVAFSIPIVCAIGVASWMNKTRYHTASPFAFGHEFLTVAWRARIETWGLFSYHYLAKNLGVALTILPWVPEKGTACFDYAQPSLVRAMFTSPHCTPFKVNEHGLALWFAVPIYLWLFRPKQRGWLYGCAAITVALPAMMDLLYQNSGWRQFGYRFSNDYSVVLFVMLAIGGASFRRFFSVAALWGLAWNLFGAITFDRMNPATDRFYFSDGSQTVLYQPDDAHSPH